jgi:streptomycin 6-kinase
VSDFFVPPLLVRTVEGWPTPEGRAWLTALPALIGELAGHWELELGPVFVPGGVTAYVAPARRVDGSHVVLKIVIPHREARDEADALRVWNGTGAVQLLDEVREHGALLLERCEPGTPLGRIEDTDMVLDIAAEVLSQLWSAPVPDAAPFEPLEAIADWFAELVVERQQKCGRPVDARLVGEALEALRDLPRSASARVVVHHDFHPGNVLAAQRQPWLAIDPKPQVGDPAFDPLQLILQTSDPLDDPDPAETIGSRLVRLSETLRVDADRVRAWGVARCVEWSLSYYEDGDVADARSHAEYARIFSTIRT